MKNAIAIAVLAVMMLSLFSGIVAEEVEAGAGDENYEDHSQENGVDNGADDKEDSSQARSEPRTRNKDN